MALRLTRSAFARVYPKLSLKLSQRGSGAQQTPRTGNIKDCGLGVDSGSRTGRSTTLDCRSESFSKRKPCSAQLYRSTFRSSYDQKSLIFTLHGGTPLPQVLFGEILAEGATQSASLS